MWPYYIWNRNQDLCVYFLSGSGGSRLKWIKTLVRLLVRQHQQCIQLTNITTNKNGEMVAKLFIFWLWTLAKVGAHGSQHWQLAPLSLLLGCRSEGMRSVLFSAILSPHNLFLYLCSPRAVTQCKPVIARDELRTANTNISQQTTLPAEEKSFSKECGNRLLLFLWINERGLSLFWQLIEHFLIPPQPRSSPPPPKLDRVPHP